MRDERGMIEAKWVRIMCDYCADPLWGPGGAMEYLEDFPVTVDLRQRLQAWEDQYDSQNPGGPSPPLDMATFSREGRELARRVKEQLPDWTVIYFDEEASAMRGRDAPRSIFEYEIVLSIYEERQ